MDAFLISIIVLVGGYFVYGLLIERVLGIDPKRLTPAYALTDGVDYTPMPTWRVFLIQFLNIAGVGPIFGAIMGVMFGPAAFLWIVFGTIFAGAVHDFVSAQMSIRSGGKSLPDLVGNELGTGIRRLMVVFSIVLLVLVGAVFVKTPATLLAGLTGWDVMIWIGLIFVYYIAAMLMPIDKLIGKIYPLFGAALLFMAVGLMGYLLFGGVEIPHDMTSGLGNRLSDPSKAIFPMMFVSIACGAISGFHATQSPMMVRCLKNERLARPVFYGAMVAEGLVALVWAASAIAFTGGYEQLAAYMQAHGNDAGKLVSDISFGWLGIVGGCLAMLGVVAAPITTGDTALRSARLISADFFVLDQRPLYKRLAVSAPIFGACFALLFIDFDILWRYFAWSNQTLAVFTLWAATVWLARRRRLYIVTLIPAMFMTAVSITYILYAPEGFGLDMTLAVCVALVVDAIFLALFMRSAGRLAAPVEFTPKSVSDRQ